MLGPATEGAKISDVSFVLEEGGYVALKIKEGSSPENIFKIENSIINQIVLHFREYTA